MEEVGSDMKFYFAPMEGVSGYIYRNAYHKHFHNMDRYFTPFIAPSMLPVPKRMQAPSKAGPAAVEQP